MLESSLFVTLGSQLPDLLSFSKCPIQKWTLAIVALGHCGQPDRRTGLADDGGQPLFVTLVEKKIKVHFHITSLPIPVTVVQSHRYTLMTMPSHQYEDASTDAGKMVYSLYYVRKYLTLATIWASLHQIPKTRIFNNTNNTLITQLYLFLT